MFNSNKKKKVISEKEVKDLKKTTTSKSSSQENIYGNEKVEFWGKANPLGVTTSFRFTEGNKVYEEEGHFSADKFSESDDDSSVPKIMEIDETKEELEKKKAQELEEDRIVKLVEQPDSSQQTQQIENEPNLTYQEWLSIGKYNGWIFVLSLSFVMRGLI